MPTCESNEVRSSLNNLKPSPELLANSSATTMLWLVSSVRFRGLVQMEGFVLVDRVI